MNSVHFESGLSEEIAIVLSCPGKDEEEATPQGPAKGQTGTNLNAILNILTNDFNRSGFTRTDIVVTNSWAQVEYIKKTQRAEAELQQVLGVSNLNRLASEIENISKYIVACGENAKVSVSMLEYAGKLKEGVKIIYIKHLGSQAINLNVSTDIDGNEIVTYSRAADKPDHETRSLVKIENDNMTKRLTVVAHEVNQQLTRRLNGTKTVG
ncbi:hypothetical protein [Neptunomonas antarctica]|uniref:Uncharacterized protein n=1 Tax=Neptunomonas antarctica TaxID=619304 RepID=A0A1N7PPJ4_9GAMM|nr:hypothetical protein [Neptunomonas antarctica]SIT12475.1 hypothetical protein SAMN05421760_1182 [Neptunomonas antarctica]